ncbi:MAG: ParB N-terminal domain-containing protein [Marinosulfonomonas sp.]|nr:ParB N-terminal domain-containing protein [Marinosulfonomonas sp.]
MKDHINLPEAVIRRVPVNSLTPYANNPRTHTNKQIRQIADSILEFGWTNPVLIDGEGGVIAGHGRIEAAKLLAISEVPVVELSHLSEAQKRAYIIADNKLAENAGWDEDLLKIELEGLLALDFDVSLTGFEMGEIDGLLIGEAADGPDARDDLPETAGGPAVTEPGDLWILGHHRVLCGDATIPESWTILMGDDKAQMVFTDPPYNVPIDGHVSGLGSVKHREFAMASGEMSETEFTKFLTDVLGNLAEFSADGSIHYACMDWAHLRELLTAGHAVYDELKNICVWAKTNGGMGSLYRSQHEMVVVFKSGTAPHINNVELGRHGRYRTNVWTYAGMNTFGAERDEALAMHPTVKPVALVEDAIFDCSDRNGIVVDAFLGSGTTLIAAESAGRWCFGLELDPEYVDLIIRRWQKVTGENAVHAGSGLSFDVLA